MVEACRIPLYFDNKLRIYIHAIDDKVISVGNNVRLPKSYHRFVGLIEKLYSTGIIKEGEKKLLEIKNMGFGELIDKINPKEIIGLSTKGATSSYEKLAKVIGKDSCIVVGGFPKGHFSDQILKSMNNLVSVDENPLEAHVIISRLLYEYEKELLCS